MSYIKFGVWPILNVSNNAEIVLELSYEIDEEICVELVPDIVTTIGIIYFSL